MFYNADCNYIIKVIGEQIIIECFTKQRVKENIRHKTGSIVYKVLATGQLTKLAIIKPYNQ